MKPWTELTTPTGRGTYFNSLDQPAPINGWFPLLIPHARLTAGG